VIFRLFSVANKLYKILTLTRDKLSANNPRISKAGVHRAVGAVALAAGLAAVPASATITPDATSQQVVTGGSTSLSFSHALGVGSNRLVVCSVQIANSNAPVANVTPTVNFNGIPMTAIPETLAPTTVQASTSRIELEMFYLNDTNLGSTSGSVPVSVTVPSATQSGLSAICTSFFGVAQAAPEAKGQYYSGSAPTPSVALTTATTGDLIVDSLIGGFNVNSTGKSASPNAGQNPLYYQMSLPGGFLIGSSYKIAPGVGTYTLGWLVTASRGAQSAVAFAPANTGATCNFTSNVIGQGTVTPTSSSYSCGTTINLTATPASGYVFTSWTGTGSGYSGTNSSASFVLTQDTTETATFTAVPMCTLTTGITAGVGTITPASGSTYPCGTQLTVQAFPAAQYVFNGWGSALSGNANPTTLALDSSATVSATFSQNTSSVTGDSRTVVEPHYPPVCSTLSAQQVDSSLQESMPDTARVQAALNACAPGQAVEFSSSDAYNAFIIAPITLPPGVTMLVDPDVTVFGSINYSDYSCSTSTGWCTPLINVLPNTDPAPGSGIMGLGVIDGRGGAPLTDKGMSWWATLGTGTDARPRLIFLGDNSTHAPADNFTLYKITLRNSPKFHVSGVGNNLTVWGIRIYAPPDSPNTDGVDPSGSKNITITNSYISDGDDHIAPKAGVGHVSNITISNNHFYSGHGVSVGSETNAGLNNMYVHDNAFDVGATYFGGSSAGAIRIKSDVSRGGEVHDVLYENTCINNGGNPVVFNPYYSAATGSLIPNFHDITIRNLHQLVRSSHKSTLEGYNTSGTVYPLTVTLDNVVFESATQSDFSAPGQVNNAQITLGPGPSNIGSFLTNDTVDPTNNITVYTNVSNNNAPLDCSNAFVYLSGDLTASANTAVTGEPFTVTALLQNAISPPMSGAIAYPQQNMPSGGTIQLLEGTNVVTSATIASGSRLTSLIVPSMTTGTHVYTAQYLGDSNYTTPFTFGSFTVTASDRAPVANNQSVTVAYNTATPITLNATGTGTLVYSVVAGPAHGTLSGTAPNLTYTPASGYAGSDNFTFKANNGTDSNIATVSITVSNAAPVANSQLVTVVYNTATSITLSATGNGTLAYSVVAGPAHGTLSGTAPSLTYTPSAGYAGADSFAFKANNGTDSNVATVTISVSNAAPVANNQTVTVGFNTATPITLSATGTGTLVYSVVAGPAHGTLSGAAPNLTYTPASGYAGADSFTFKANNGTDSNVATVSIAVSAGFTWTPVSGGSTTVTVTAGQTATYNLQFSGSTAATGIVTFSCAGAPLYATCTVTPGSSTLTGVTPIPVTVSVTTRNTLASMREEPAPWGQGKGLPAAFLAGVFGFAFGLRRRLKVARLLQAVILALALSAACFVTGCGSGSNGASKTKTFNTSPGTYPLTVTATTSGVTQNVSLTLIVQ
jgi:polygalacturonase